MPPAQPEGALLPCDAHPGQWKQPGEGEACRAGLARVSCSCTFWMILVVSSVWNSGVGVMGVAWGLWLALLSLGSA